MPGLIRTLGQHAAAVLLLLAADPAPCATIDQTKAAGVMASYLRHIAGLTTWPAGDGGAATRPLHIGVLGSDPNGVLTTIRARIASGRELLAQKRPITLLELPDAIEAPEAFDAAIAPCGLLYLSDGTQELWAGIRNEIATRPIVTVSEMEGFASQGGIVEFFIDLSTQKVRLIVNVDAMQRAGVKLSARLLGLDSVIIFREQGARP